jgi:hypothetical protein
MQKMVFVRTRYIGEHGKIRANLANTTLSRGGVSLRYTHSLSVSDNHYAAAIAWVTQKMPGMNSVAVGVQSYDNGNIYAFSLN